MILGNELNFALRLSNVDDNRPKCILWTDTTHFMQNGPVSTKDCVIWTVEYPYTASTEALHDLDVSVLRIQ